MRRCSMYLGIQENWVGIDATKSLLDKQLFQLMGASQIYRIAQISKSEIIINLKSDLELSKLAVATKSIEKSLNAQYHKIGWGWPSHQQSDVIIPGELDDEDSFASVKPQSAPSVIYSIYAMQASILMAFLPASIVSVALLSSQEGFPFFWFGICILLLGILLFHQVKRVECNEAGLRVVFWIRSSINLSWSQIKGLNIVSPRMIPWCRIQTYYDELGYPLMFLVGQWPKQTEDTNERITLVKSIIVRATLLYVESAPWGRATYKRFEAD